jgi:dolichyl-phosphate-mannose--protein O-mannosyl transferase
LAIGTPILWWVGIFAIATTFGFFITQADKSSAVVLAGVAGTYLPWFFIQSRTTFYFYSIAILPFLVLAVINLLNWAIGKGLSRRYVYTYLVLVGINFVYFLPILIGLEISYSDWLARMWLPSWI